MQAALPEPEDDRFGLVLLISVLEHLAEALSVLEQCRRVLRPTAYY